MTRRGLFGMLAGLPFVSLLMPKKVAAAAPQLVGRKIAEQVVVQGKQATRLRVYSPGGYANKRDEACGVWRYRYFREYTDDFSYTRQNDWKPLDPRDSRYPGTYPEPGVSYSQAEYRLNLDDPRGDKVRV